MLSLSLSLSPERTKGAEVSDVCSLVDSPGEQGEHRNPSSILPEVGLACCFFIYIFRVAG